MAIEERECDLLVAAAAGAGKTAVLVERIIRRIINDESPVDIDNMLVVTFTNAAASEMRERIGEALEKAIEKEPKSQRLHRQMILLGKASITTIHSFCMDVVKNNYHRLDLNPDFRIADETESYLLKLEALDDMFEDKYEEGAEEFLQLLDAYGGNRDDEKLKNMVLEVYDFVQSTPWPEEWLHAMSQAYYTGEDFDFSRTLWAEIIMEFAQMELEGCLNLLKKAERIAISGEGLDKCAAQLAEDINTVDYLLQQGRKTWDDLFNAFKDFAFSRQQAVKNADKEAYEEMKEIRKEAKDRINKFGSDFFTCSSSDIKGDLDSLYPLIKYLSLLVLDFHGLYTEKKKEKGIIDFNDLEHFSLQILTQRDDFGNIKPSPVALSIRDRFAEILTDEYQDSNMVQEVILNIISKRDDGNPNMFMVGDVKQSIYRFRQAKPELFLDKYSRYSDISGAKERKIKLFKNFRSREEIINGVNCLFRQLMTKYVGEIDYDKGEFLNPGALYPKDEEGYECSRDIELHILDLMPEDKNRLEENDEENADDELVEDEEDLDDIQAEARLVALRILELMGSYGDNDKAFRVYDKDLKAYRNVDYKDIVILLRTVRNWSETFVEELEGMGIPAFADTGSGYFKRMEVMTVLSLLQIIDNPMQDIPLISLLKSPIGGFTSEELLEIRLGDKDNSFYEAMKIMADKDDDIGKKTKNFLGRLDVWREKALHMPTDQLIWYLLYDTGYMSYVGAMPQGHQRQANLRILFERAKQYEETSYKGLFNFINFIEKLKAGSGDMGNAKILGEKDNVVRIMSIHKSKGLEFPVVILAGTGKKFNMQDMSKTMLLHHELGFGTDLVDTTRRISYSTLPKIALKHKIKMETLSEEMRILYVALTRAKEKLIITGYDKNFEKTLNKWTDALDCKLEKLPPHIIIKGGKYLNWIGPALIRHKRLVTLRDMCGKSLIPDEFLLDDDSKWKLKIWNKSQLLKEITKEEETFDIREILKELEENKDERKPNDDIEKRLSWIYPHIKSTKLPTKLSVTELKRIKGSSFGEELSESIYKTQKMRKPVFMQQEKTMTGAERGSIIHYIMQHLDLKYINSIEEIKAQIDKMVIEEFLTNEQAKVADINRILKFFNSPIGRRMKTADKVYREMAFNMEISPQEVFAGEEYRDSQDNILLQGVIDCYFIEKGKIVLLDYKTDYIDGNEREYANERYGIQIAYYSNALERALGKKIDEKYIYFFHTGNAVEVWSL